MPKSTPAALSLLAPVAVWRDEFGSVYEWPQGCADNRKSRVLRRIENYGMGLPVDDTLRIFRDPADARAYGNRLHAGA